jgi:hypothetical protein
MGAVSIGSWDMSCRDDRVAVEVGVDVSVGIDLGDVHACVSSPRMGER